MPLPEPYAALRAGVVSSAIDGDPVTRTRSSNSMSMSIVEPATYVPSSVGEETDSTDGGSVSIRAAAPGPPDREPGAPGSGSVRLATLPTRSVTTPPASAARPA